MGIVYLYIYAALIALIIFYSTKKQKSFMYISVWWLYFISAIFCILCKTFQDDLVGRGFSHDQWYDLSDTTLWGYLLIIICSLIAFKPFENYKSELFIDKFGTVNRERKLALYIAYSFIALFVVYVLTSFSNIRSAFSVSDYGSLRTDLYDNTTHGVQAAMSNNTIGNLAYKIIWNFRLLVIFVGGILIKDKRKAKLGYAIIVADIFFVYVYASLNAARGGLVIFLLCVFLFLYPIIKNLPRRVKFTLGIAIIIIVMIVGSYLIEVTVSRTAGNTSGGNLVLKNFAFYLGHGPIIFSKITGSLKGFAFGKLVGGRLLNHFFGLPFDGITILENIGYPSILNNLFYTYLGPIYMDFGSLGCIIIYALWAWVMNKVMSEHRIRLSTIYLLSYYLFYFITGAFVIGVLEYASVITTFIVWMLFRLFENTFIYNKKY